MAFTGNAPRGDSMRWGDAFPKLARLENQPMVIDGMILFHCGNQLLGVQEDRISYVGARGNAEFSTRPFQMPGADLLLNACSPSRDRPFGGVQAYIMVAVLDEHGKTVPGFEAEKCLIKKMDATELPLRWAQKNGPGPCDAHHQPAISPRQRQYLRRNGQEVRFPSNRASISAQILAARPANATVCGLMT